ncbi:MAG: hypothetical protein KY464_01650 [Gemmatimonadetes bacterium]|nr:hypothetical protein [Gemmatimonadota bacterium]
MTLALSHSRALALVLLLGGCSGQRAMPARPAPETLPAESPLLSRSLADSDAWLRHYLFVGEARTAVDALQPKSPLAPRDGLLRALQEGIVLHQAGEYRRSNQALEWAEVEADRRYTRSVSREVASFVINDGVVGYTPPAGELVMVPYYRILNYLALRDVAAAMVEARKATALIARLDRSRAQRCREDGMLLYLAGMVQEMGGELNDALVSLRQAQRAFASCESAVDVERAIAGDLHRLALRSGVTEVADSVAVKFSLQSATPRPGGDLLLLVEHGFVAHRAEQALHVPIFPEELDGLESSNLEQITAVAARVTTRLLDNASEKRVWGRAWDDAPLVQWANALEGAYVLRLAWPALRLEATRPAAVRVWVDDSVAAVSTAGDLTAMMHREMEQRRAAMLTRLVARGVVKYLLSREVEKKSEEKGGEAAGFLMGRLANFAANRLEQADLRSWSLLPDRISMVRTRLPEGVHRVRIETLGADGQVTGVRDLGEVTIRPNETLVLGQRVWGDDNGDLPLPAGPPGHAAETTASAK